MNEQPLCFTEIILYISGCRIIKVSCAVALLRERAQIARI
jgi:hypothetical protein